MAAALSLSFVEGILSKLGSSTVPFLAFVFCFNDEKRKLTNTLSAISALVLDAEKQQEMSHCDEDWVGKLRIILYEADDLAEEVFLQAEEQRELNVERNIGDKILYFFKTTLPFYIRMAWELKAIRERLENVAADRAKFPPIAQRDGGKQNENKETRIEPQTYIHPADIIGREEEKKAIKNMIEDEEVKVSKVPIVIAIIGMGGLGKTTLARSVYEDPQGFQLKLWVWVSQNFDVKRLLIEVIVAALGKESNLTGMEGLDKLQSKVRECLDGKKYLLVLDDIWTTDIAIWNQLGNLLKVGAKGSVILATTRETNVAFTIGATPKYQYPLKDLKGDYCLSLFEQQLGFKLCQMKEEHISVGKEILKKCGGIPLAIMTVAGLLRYLDPETEWQSVKNDELWSQAQEGTHILPSLRVSYARLPSNLKKCFAYCSLFHKGGKIEKAMLTQLWLAQGFTEQPSNKRPLTDSGDKCFKELRNRSFFQDIEEDDFGNVKSCKMHDLMHDLAKVVAGSEYVIVNGEAVDNSDKVVHASVTLLGILRTNARNSVTVLTDGILPTNARNLRTLLTVGIDFDSKQDFYKLASPFKRLRVLDAHAPFTYPDGSDDPAINPILLNSIGMLKHLRYLDLSSRNIIIVPDSICELRYLQTLKLNWCYELKELPGEIKKLVSLIHLENHGCHKLKGMPVGIGQLTSIQTLSLYVLGGEGSGGLSELENLNNLRGGLCIKNLHNARNATSESRKALYLEKKHLQSLGLDWGWMREGYRDKDVALLESLQPNPHLKILDINGYSGVKFPSWMDNIGKSLPNLVEIWLYNCPSCECLPLFADQLQFLKILYLCDLPKLEFIHSYVSESSSSPTSSSFNSNIPSGVAAWFPSLKEISLWKLPKLKEWRREVIVRGKPKTESVAVMQSKRLLSLDTLSTLTIWRCPELTSMPLLPNIEELKLSDSSGAVIESMTMAETTPTTSSLPPLVTHSKLRSISIRGCNDLVSLPQGWLENPTSLEHMSIRNCAELMSLSPETPHMLKDLKGKALDLSKEDDLQSFTRLLSLYLQNLPKLTSLPKGLQYATNLERLSIVSCDGLVSWLDSMGNITSLQFLEIGGLQTLTSLPQGLRHLTALERLELGNCPELNFSDDDNDTPIPTNLHSLTLSALPKLTFLPDWLKVLTNLRSLSLRHLPKLMFLPDWLKVLTSLQELQIYLCKELKSLPETMSCLTALQRLKIWGCPQLPETHQRDNISPKIAHTPEIWIDRKYLQRKRII